MASGKLRCGIVTVGRILDWGWLVGSMHNIVTGRAYHTQEAN